MELSWGHPGQRLPLAAWKLTPRKLCGVSPPVSRSFAAGAETPGHGLVWSRQAESGQAQQEDLFRDPDADDFAEGLDEYAHSVSSIPLAGLTRGDLDKVYCTGYEAELLRMALEGQDARWEAALTKMQAEMSDAFRRIQALEHELAWR